tara:strand:+ start:11608 stop:12150 length:543 start_codon:yes stop_codon:yes gene_type:complete
MKKIILGIWITLTAITNLADPSYGFDSKKKYYFHGNELDFSQPPCEFSKILEPDPRYPIKIVAWIPEEVPRNISFYVDFDGDKKADIIFALPLIQVLDYQFCNEIEVKQDLLKCKIFQIYPDLIKVVAYPTPKVYVILKEWVLYRYVIDGKVGPWLSGLRSTNINWFEEHLNNLQEWGGP